VTTGDRTIDLTDGQRATAPPRQGLTDRHIPDDGKGRHADSPLEIPAKGWRDVLKRSFKQLKADNVPILSAAVAFYLFLSLIPGLAACISLYGLVSDPREVAQTISDLTSGLPPAARELVVDQATQIADAEPSKLSLSLAISVAVALFSASKGTQSLVKALNITYNEPETRGFLKLRLLSLGLTIAIFLFAIAAVVAIVKVGDLAQDLPGGGMLVTALRWPLLGALLVVVLAGLYRVSPDRNDPKLRWTTPGAIVAAILIAVASLALSVYTSRFGDQAESGVLGAVGVLLLWLFACAYMILLGAEIDSELEHQTARDTTVGPEEPLGERDANMADTVAR
jgi:membrane protein